ncbi:MAG: hypothetical protein K0S08_649 [Gammaproteobacteria bacterium]|jgi:hypothetical protein|nr:hypothetical protein [Gammaproteobacteria bacterium]
MTYDDMPLFLDRLTELAIFYDEEEFLTPHLIDIYWCSLKRFDLEAIFYAIKKYQANQYEEEKMPMPADIKRYLEDSLILKAQKAWLSVAHAIQYFGVNHTVIFDDKIIHVALDDMGGWIKLCSVLPDLLEIQESEFQKKYVAYSLHPPVKYPRALRGVGNAENIQNCFQQIVPVLVGDTEKAKHVYLNGVDDKKLNLSEAFMRLIEPAGVIEKRLDAAIENVIH